MRRLLFVALLVLALTPALTKRKSVPKSKKVHKDTATAGSASTIQCPVAKSEGYYKLVQRGNELYAAQNMVTAAACYEAATEVAPNESLGWSNWGLTQVALGKLDGAVALIRRALKLNPAMPDAYHALGSALHNKGEHSAAAEAIKQTIKYQPKNFQAYNNLGNIFITLNRLEDSAAAYRDAVALSPNQGDLHANLGRVLCALPNKWDEGEKAFQRAVTLSPNSGLVYQEYAIALKNSKRMNEAEKMFTRALRIVPTLPDVYYHLGELYSGDIHTENKRVPEAIKAHTFATTLRPTYAESYMSLAMLYWSQGQLETAATLLSHSIANKPLAEAAANLGIVQSDLGHYEDALGSFRKAQSWNPNLAEGYKCMGDTYKHVNKWVDATEQYEHALRVRPNYVEALNDMVHALQHTCEWEKWSKSFEALVAALEKEFQEGRKPLFVKPFHALVYPLDPRHMLLVAQSYAARAVRLTKSLVRTPLPLHFELGKNHALRIGYVSSNIGDHSLSHLMQNVFGMHGKRTKVYVFALNPDDKSRYRQKIRSDVGSKRFFDGSTMSGVAVGRQVNSHKIHVLVDLVGYTGGGEKANEVFAVRPTPYALSYMGFCFSTGADYMNHMVVDRIVAPPENQAQFSEKMLLHPNSYFVADHRQSFADVVQSLTNATRKEFDLPEKGPLLACHNQLYKIDPSTFDIWMSVLREQKDAHLWLLKFPQYAEKNIKKHAVSRGVEEHRLVMSNPVEKAKYMRRISVADVFLDTPLVNAHTSATDALWAGLPILTTPREPIISRVASSLLVTAGETTLLASTPDEYQRMLTQLVAPGGGQRRLDEVRRQLASARHKTPLFDTPSWVRNYERGIFMAWDARVAGLDVHIIVNER